MCRSEVFKNVEKNTVSLLRITSYENEPLITLAFLLAASLCKVKNILQILHKPSYGECAGFFEQIFWENWE